MTTNTMTMPVDATPVTMMMDTDTFYLWLGEVQGIDEGIECKAPNFHLEEWEDMNRYLAVGGQYSEIAAYLNTSEGTVIAKHLWHVNMVKVTFRHAKPTDGLMRTVRLMLCDGETGAGLAVSA
jgi:hypothetical protein